MENNVHAILIQPERKEADDLKGRIYEESKKIWRVALPGIIARVCVFGAVVVTQAFIGHLNSTDLAGYSLVQAFLFAFASGILIGMSSGTETLCAQAYGSKQYDMVGLYLQRSWVVDLLTLTVMIPIFIFGESIFRLLGEAEGPTRSAGYIAWLFIPLMYSTVFTLTMQMYLQAQDKNAIVAWIHLAQFVIHVALSWLFVSILNWGVNGAMAALNVSSWFAAFAEFVYICGGWCPGTWKGFSIGAFKDLWPVFKLSISSGIMVWLEMLYMSVLVLLAGHMNNAEVTISAFSICLNIYGWELMICLGFLGAGCVRVASELGRGNAKTAKFSVEVLITTSVAIGVILAILCLVFRNSFGWAFTNDEEVVRTLPDLSLLLAFAILLCSIFPVLSGVALGAGLQDRVAFVNLFSIYLIGLPVGAVLGYVANLQVKGMWLGILVGVLAQCLTLAYMTWKTDWKEKVRLAAEHSQH